jgi:hypothetical protein
VAATVRPAPVRPAFKRLAWWALPVLLFIGAWQVWDAIEAGRLERAISPVRSGGGLAREAQAPSTDNAARYYAAAAMAAVARTRDSRVQIAPGEPIQDVLKVVRDAMSQGSDAPAPALEAASRQMQSDDVVFELLRRGSALPFGGFAAGTEFNYRFSGLFEVGRSASLRTLELIRRGDGDAATRVLVDRAQLLRAFDQSQGLIASASKAALVRDIATDVGILVGASPSDDSLRDLGLALERVYASDEFERGIRAEILRRDEVLRRMLSTRGPIAVIVLRPLVRHQFVEQLQTMKHALEKAQLPWPDRIRELNQVPVQRQFLPAVLRVFGFWNAPELTAREAEGVADWRCAKLAIEVEQFRRERGRLPQTLEELARPDGSEEVSDPFTGRSLRYSASGGEFVIYSVGRNLQDESGALIPKIPPGRAPNTVSRPDVGVRVPARRSKA